MTNDTITIERELAERICNALDQIQYEIGDDPELTELETALYNRLSE